MTSSLVLSDFLGVAVTLNLAVAERVGATFRRKELFFLLGTTEEVVATIIVGGNFFSFRGLTKKEISVII